MITKPTIEGLAAYVDTKKKKKNVIIYTLLLLTPYDYVSLRLWAWQSDYTKFIYTPYKHVIS